MEVPVSDQRPSCLGPVGRQRSWQGKRGEATWSPHGDQNVRAGESKEPQVPVPLNSTPPRDLKDSSLGSISSNSHLHPVAPRAGDQAPNMWGLKDGLHLNHSALPHQHLCPLNNIFPLKIQLTTILRSASELKNIIFKEQSYYWCKWENSNVEYEVDSIVLVPL